MDLYARSRLRSLAWFCVNDAEHCLRVSFHEIHKLPPLFGLHLALILCEGFEVIKQVNVTLHKNAALCRSRVHQQP